jgi:O-glycosyl hydrolase
VSTRTLLRFLSASVITSAGLLSAGCEPNSTPQTTDSQTNWLKSCSYDAECGAYSCVCNVCTLPCGSDEACADAPGSVCVGADDPGAVAVCGGSPAPGAGMCLPACGEGTCASGQTCLAGVCTVSPVPTTSVNVGTGTRYQSLIGFGAGEAFGEAGIVSNPRSAALYRAAFADLGLDLIRLRDRYGRTGEDDLSTARAVVDGAANVLGRTPTILLSSWSPPPSLKANGAVNCGASDACTLRQVAGAFDYAGFGAYWRSSIDAYVAAGVVPDYVGIQNNANWQPGAGQMSEACRFLPVEGTAPVVTSGGTVNLAFAGYAEALAATLSAFAGLANPPRILAPETTDFESVADYANELPPGSVDALAHHLYGVDPLDIDTTALDDMGSLGTSMGKPIIQTEMGADGFGTAVLVHHMLAVEGASAYVQAALTGPTSGPYTNPNALLGISSTDFTLQEPYHAMRHFALHTDPGWVRVDAASSRPNMLASAWLSPSGDALTVVLVNQGAREHSAALTLDAAYSNVSVTRTVFDGTERFADLGGLGPEAVVVMPPRSVVTVAYSN